MRNIEILTIDTHRRVPDLGRLEDQIKNDPNLLHPGLAVMKDSYENGLAAIGVNESGEAVAYSRLIPLLSQSQSEQLEIPEPLTHIYEMGTVFVSPTYRDQGLGRQVQQGAIEHMHNGGGERLILGTTKTLREIRALGNISIPGIQFTPAHHFDYPMIAPLTCICNPDFGCGFQYGSECPQRIEKDKTVVLFQNGRIPRKGELPTDEIKCTMFVSHPQIAQKFNEGLENHFGTQEKLVNALKGVGYFE